MQYKHEIKDTIWLIGLQGLNYIAPLLVWPYLMVVLGAEAFGKIGFAQSLCLYLMLVVDFGFNFTATKRIAIAHDNLSTIQQIVNETMCAKIGLLILCFVSIILLTLVPQYTIYRAALFALFGQVVGNTFSFTWLYQGMGRIRQASIINSICKISILPLCFLLVKSEQDYLLAAGIQASVYLCSAIILSLIAIKNGWWQRIYVSVKGTMNAIKESVPVFISNAISGIYGTAFVVLLGYFVTADEVGRYAATEKLMRAVLSVSLIPLIQAFYPKVAQVANADNARARHLVGLLAIITMTIMVAVGFLFYFGGEQIAYLLGKDYTGCIELFQRIAPIPFFVGLSAVFGQMGLLATGQEREKQAFLIVYTVAAIVALVGIILVGPSEGSAGAIKVLTITEMVAAMGMIIAYINQNIKKSC